MTVYISRDKSNAELAHYGVKGMKWNKHLKAQTLEGFHTVPLRPIPLSLPRTYDYGQNIVVRQNTTNNASQYMPRKGAMSSDKANNRRREALKYMPGKGASASNESYGTRKIKRYLNKQEASKYMPSKEGRAYSKMPLVSKGKKLVSDIFHSIFG